MTPFSRCVRSGYPSATQLNDGTADLAEEGRAQGDLVTIRPLATPHARLEHYSYVVEWNGQRLYFTGDTEDTAALLAVIRCTSRLASFTTSTTILD